MHWSNVYILNLEPNDPIISRHVALWRARYNIPNSCCFSTVKKTGFKFLNYYVLRNLTLHDKVQVFAHGSIDDVAGYKAAELATALADWGMAKVGLLAIKSCSAGRGTLLDDLKTACEAKGMKVGWYLGYKGPVYTNSSQHDCTGILDTLLDIFNLRHWLKDSDNRRVKVLEGNAKVTPRPAGSRYVHA